MVGGGGMRMKVGLLWLDAEGELEEKVARAVRRYGEKFGEEATVCYVHPSVVEGSEGAGERGSGGNGTGRKVGGVRVEGLGSVLPGHFWVGVEEGGG